VTAPPAGRRPRVSNADTATAAPASRKTDAGVETARIPAATSGPISTPIPSTIPVAPFAAVRSSGSRARDGSSDDWVGRVVTKDAAAITATR
jgi:hypothetical protein